MPPLPPNNTARYKAFYTMSGIQHSLQTRSTQSPAAMGGWYNNFWTTFTTNLYAFTFDYMVWAPAGSDIFNIVTSGYEGTIYGLGPAPTEAQAYAYTFVGRTAGGRRSRITQFGPLGLSSNYRVTAGENAAIDNVLAALAASAGVLQGIDGLPILWKQYADVQVNDHWVKELRP